MLLFYAALSSSSSRLLRRPTALAGGPPTRSKRLSEDPAAAYHGALESPGDNMKADLVSSRENCHRLTILEERFSIYYCGIRT
jgi:hypothetical protein